MPLATVRTNHNADASINSGLPYTYCFVLVDEVLSCMSCIAANFAFIVEAQFMLHV